MLLTACVQRAPRNDATMPFGKVYSGPRKAIPATDPALNRNGELPLVFTATTNWISGLKTNLRLRGAGAPGAAAIPGVTRWRVMDDYQSFYVETAGSGGTGQPATRVVSAGYTTALEAAQNQPADYDEYIYYEWGHERIHHDFYYESYSTTVSETTGADSRAFDNTFPGGVGGPATITTFPNVIVLPETQYQLIVPTGGFIEIYGAQ